MDNTTAIRAFGEFLYAFCVAFCKIEHENKPHHLQGRAQ